MSTYMPHSAIPPLFSLDDARRQLALERRPKPAALKMLAAAAVLALSTLLLAASVILGPFWQTKDPSSMTRAPMFDHGAMAERMRAGAEIRLSHRSVGQLR